MASVPHEHPFRRPSKPKVSQRRTGASASPPKHAPLVGRASILTFLILAARRRSQPTRARWP